MRQTVGTFSVVCRHALGQFILVTDEFGAFYLVLLPSGTRSVQTEAEAVSQ